MFNIKITSLMFDGRFKLNLSFTQSVIKNIQNSSGHEDNYSFLFTRGRGVQFRSASYFSIFYYRLVVLY